LLKSNSEWPHQHWWSGISLSGHIFNIELLTQTAVWGWIIEPWHQQSLWTCSESGHTWTILLFTHAPELDGNICSPHKQLLLESLKLPSWHTINALPYEQYPWFAGINELLHQQLFCTNLFEFGQISYGTLLTHAPVWDNNILLPHQQWNELTFELLHILNTALFTQVPELAGISWDPQ